HSPKRNRTLHSNASRRILKIKQNKNQKLIHILIEEKVVKIHNTFLKKNADETIGRLKWTLNN
ncbi:MAG: hypothetical protein NUK62_08520, partial [Tenericutes bacterium]|nr:hypothetical protein [Mycoplasmatota bacterium]